MAGGGGAGGFDHSLGLLDLLDSEPSKLFSQTLSYPPPTWRWQGSFRKAQSRQSDAKTMESMMRVYVLLHDFGIKCIDTHTKGSFCASVK